MNSNAAGDEKVGHVRGLLPWHRQAWDMLLARRRSGTLPHALLLRGNSGLGKNHFALLLTQGLLCEQAPADGLPCGGCRGCRLFLAGSHPDVLSVSPAEEGKAILIDQIRELCAYTALKSQRAGYQIAIISPAERMNTAAVNSLLKTLEEPTDQTLLILVSARPNLLPATIRSRCQQVQFNEPPRDTALAWLAPHIGEHDPELLLGLAGGAPLRALELAGTEGVQRRTNLFNDFLKVVRGEADPVGVAETWARHDAKECLSWLSGWVIDMIRLKSAGLATQMANRDFVERLQWLAERLDLNTLYGHLDRTLGAFRLLDGQLNQQLLLEDLLTTWVGVARGR